MDRLTYCDARDREVTIGRIQMLNILIDGSIWTQYTERIHERLGMNRPEDPVPATGTAWMETDE